MNEELNAVEMTIDQAEAKILLMEKWEKLLKNPLFDELVTKEYLGDDAVRLAINIKPKADDNEVVHNFLMAKAIFSRYVGEKISSGFDAIEALAEHKALRDDINSEL